MNKPLILAAAQINLWVGEIEGNVEKIIAAAKQTGAEAIHPGYGFLSENADFAQAVLDAGLIWVGPKADSIRAMGLKDAAKALMEKAGVPVVPGYHGAGQDANHLAEEAARIGYPVLIKAVAGGGGKGMRLVERPEDLATALQSAQGEAAPAFGNPAVLIEKYIQQPRHIEVQVFGDGTNAVPFLSTSYANSAPNLLAVTGALLTDGAEEDDSNALRDLRRAAVNSLLARQRVV